MLELKLLTRILIAIPAILLQFSWMLLLAWLWDEDIAALIDFIVGVASVQFVLYIVTKRDEGSYKILWLILILS